MLGNSYDQAAKSKVAGGDHGPIERPTERAWIYSKMSASWGQENPLSHLHEDEAPVKTDKLTSLGAYGSKIDIAFEDLKIYPVKQII